MADISKVVAPGDVSVFSCPSGSTPELKAGDLLPNAENAQFFVSSVNGADFVIGPMKAGSADLTYKCSDGSEQTTLIEVPAQEPDKLPPAEGPLGMIAFDLSWLWIVIGSVLVATLVAIFIYGRKKKKLKQSLLLKSQNAQATKRDPQQLLRDMIALLDGIEKNSSSADIKADDLYQRGYRSIRGFLEKSLKLKTQAETTPQFLGSIRIAASKHKIPSDLIAKIERSMVSSDQNRFGAALHDSPESRRGYATELKSILNALLQLDAQWKSQEAQTAVAKPTKKPGAKKP